MDVPRTMRGDRAPALRTRVEGTLFLGGGVLTSFVERVSWEVWVWPCLLGGVLLLLGALQWRLPVMRVLADRLEWRRGLGWRSLAYVDVARILPLPGGKTVYLWADVKGERRNLYLPWGTLGQRDRRWLVRWLLESVADEAGGHGWAS